MPFELSTPTPAEMPAAIDALASWQSAEAPLQLHPGDVGWFFRFGVDAAAAATRIWRDGDRIVAFALLDGADMLRVTTAPALRGDPALAEQLAADAGDPARGILAAADAGDAGDAAIESPTGAALDAALASRGWAVGESWTPLQRELGDPVDVGGVRIETVDVDDDLAIADRVAVHHGAFERSSTTVEAWRAMAAGPAYRAARDLVAYDEEGTAAAGITVWSAGEGRPGLIEPMGVHRDHRGRGFGRAITLAGAAALRELGSSSAQVCTDSANVGGIAAYRAAGFEPMPERRDRTRTRG